MLPNLIGLQGKKSMAFFMCKYTRKTKSCTAHAFSFSACLLHSTCEVLVMFVSHVRALSVLLCCVPSVTVCVVSTIHFLPERGGAEGGRGKMMKIEEGSRKRRGEKEKRSRKGMRKEEEMKGRRGRSEGVILSRWY